MVLRITYKLFVKLILSHSVHFILLFLTLNETILKQLSSPKKPHLTQTHASRNHGYYHKQFTECSFYLLILLQRVASEGPRLVVVVAVKTAKICPHH